MITSRQFQFVTALIPAPENRNTVRPPWRPASIARKFLQPVEIAFGAASSAFGVRAAPGGHALASVSGRR